MIAMVFEAPLRPLAKKAAARMLLQTNSSENVNSISEKL
jgi:hypothetical protein